MKTLIIRVCTWLQIAGAIVYFLLFARLAGTSPMEGLGPQSWDGFSFSLPSKEWLLTLATTTIALSLVTALKDKCKLAAASFRQSDTSASERALDRASGALLHTAMKSWQAGIVGAVIGSAIATVTWISLSSRYQIVPGSKHTQMSRMDRWTGATFTAYRGNWRKIIEPKDWDPFKDGGAIPIDEPISQKK